MYKITIAIAIVACAASVLAFDPITLTVGTTAFVASGTQVAVAAGALAALAIAKEAIAIAEINRQQVRRGRREAESNTFDMSPIFDAIAAVDIADCGKLLVCHVHAKPEAELTKDEARIVALFSSFNGKVDPLHSQAQYQLAASTGSYKKPEVCVTQYLRCPYPADSLSALLKQ